MEFTLEEIDDILKCINGRIAWTGYLRSSNKSRKSREENLIEINEKESIFLEIGRKLIGYCLPCAQKEYHTVIEPYFDEEEDD